MLWPVLCRGNPHLQPILGVAWDCGAVTTGPVTVPILIALGVSVMKAQREKQQAFAAVEDAAVNRSEGEQTGSTHCSAGNMHCKLQPDSAIDCSRQSVARLYMFVSRRQGCTQHDDLN